MEPLSTEDDKYLVSFSKSVSSIAGSALCLGSHDPLATENKMSELLLGDEDIKEGDGKWPVEIVVAIETSGEVIVLNRDSYKELISLRPESITEKMESGMPGTSTCITYIICYYGIVFG